MLLERRSVKELEVLLAERLEQLRAGARPGRPRSSVARNQRKTA
jgi:hypothetical protein